MPTIFSERVFAGFEKELGACADQLGIPRAIFHRPDVEYPVKSFFELLECGVRKGYPHIGFSVGSSLKLADLGALGHAMRVSPTVSYALHLAAQYYDVATHGAVFRVDSGREMLLISYQLKESHGSLQPQDVELSVSLFNNVVRELSGMPISPLEVEFMHSPPPYKSTLQSYFGCDIHFNRHVNRLHYPRQIDELPVATADGSLLEALEFFLGDRLKLRKEDDLLGRVNHLITASLSEGTPSMTSIASTLGMSKRTLHRKLSEAGVNFVGLVDEIRRVIAIDYVKFSECNFTDVTSILGYSELSAFSRAFRRWTGSSPQDVRDESMTMRGIETVE